MLLEFFCSFIFKYFLVLALLNLPLFIPKATFKNVFKKFKSILFQLYFNYWTIFTGTFIDNKVKKLTEVTCCVQVCADGQTAVTTNGSEKRKAELETELQVNTGFKTHPPR